MVVFRGRTAAIAIILGGSIYYTWVKHVEAQAAAGNSPEKAYERVPLDDMEAAKKEEKD